MYIINNPYVCQNYIPYLYTFNYSQVYRHVYYERCYNFYHSQLYRDEAVLILLNINTAANGGITLR